jgi:hypothetical protein
MSPSSSGDSGDEKEAKLPRRDWILLPLLGLFTISFLAISTELTARWLFPVSEVGLDNCFARGDPSGEAPVTANSVCSERIAESRFPAEYRFDSRGHRADIELEPKSPSTYRIVMIGSSFAMGLFVPRDKTFAALLPAELSRQTGHKIELYNEASGGKFRGGPFPTQNSAARFNEVLSTSPDMILWILTSMDVENAALEVPVSVPQAAVQSLPMPGKSPNRIADVWDKLKISIAEGTVGDKLRYRWEQTRTSLVLKHLLLESDSQDQYVKSYLKNEDDAEFLKTDPNVKWQGLLRNFQINATEFERQAKAASVPFVAVLVPNRAQVAMVSMGEWPAGYDPYKLDDELRTIIASHGGIYIDILPDFSKIPSPEQHYFPVDGHPDADGHALISSLLAKALTSGAVPALKASALPQTALAQGR